VIKNSLFYGGYYPASFTVTATNNVATVTWCVDSNSIHSDTVTSDTGIFNSGPIAQSASWSYTFTLPGEYHYHSLLHFWMHGTIIVQETQSISQTTQASQYESGAIIFAIDQNQKVGGFIRGKLAYTFSNESIVSAASGCKPVR